MSNQDWLSLSEIARHWSTETGRDAEEIERDLEAWFAGLVDREATHQPTPPGGDGDTTNLLMGLLGGRALTRETFAAYCEEKGHDKPDFWFAAGAEEAEPAPAPLADPQADAGLQAGSEEVVDSEAPQFEDEWAMAEPDQGLPGSDLPGSDLPGSDLPESDLPESDLPEPDLPAPDPAPMPPWPAADWASSEASREASPESTPESTPEWTPESTPEWTPGWTPASPMAAANSAALDWAKPHLRWLRRAFAETSRVWAKGSLPTAGGVRPPRRVRRIAGGTALTLALLAVGYILGQGETEPSPTVPSAAAPTQAPAALVSTLRMELAEAQQENAHLALALDMFERDKERLTADLYEARRALDGIQAPLQPDAADPESGTSRASETAAELVTLRAELAAARAKIASLSETAAAAQDESVKRSLVEAAASASAQAMSYKAELEEARQRIGRLELEAQTVRAEADVLAAELSDIRRQHEIAVQAANGGSRPAQQDLILAAEIASTQVKLYKQDLDGALARLARVSSEAEAAKTTAASLTSELSRTRQLHSDAMKAAEVESADSRRELFLKAQSASSHVAMLDQEVDIALDQIAYLEGEVKTAKSESASLARRLAERGNGHEEALKQARAEAQARHRELIVAAETASAEAALRERQLDAALERIAELEAAQRSLAATAEQPTEAPAPTELAQEGAVRNDNGATTAQPAAADLPTDPFEGVQPATADTKGIPQLLPAESQPGQPLGLLESQDEPQPVAQQATAKSGAAQVTNAVVSSRGVTEQLAVAVAPSSAKPVDVDSLVIDPGRYEARQIVVTGSLLRLLEHYRLQSKSGLKTLVVDVAGIDRAQFDDLQDAIAGAGLIGSVRARITGTVERRSAKAFGLVAVNLTLAE